ncbi:MAG: hypothetical protein N2449_03410 [Bacteroidales bacterium]|nr:hypothetical protein [Bacteroidales bacterium]
MSFIVYFIYTHYYTDRTNADIFKYYDDGKILYSSIYSHPSDYIKMLTGINEDEKHLWNYYQKMNFWIKPYDFEIINENKTLIRINAFLSLFSFDNYFIHALFFVFLSFCGLFAIYKVLSQYVLNHHLVFSYIIFLFPSTLFWSSAILKESLVFFSLGFSLYYFNLWYNKAQWKYLISFIIFMLLLMVSKIYIFLLVLPSAFYIFITKFSPKFNKTFLFLIFHVICFLFFFYSEWFIPYNFSEIVTIKQHNFINMSEAFNAGSKIYLPYLDDNIISFALLTPIALINTLFRPFIWEAHNILSLLASLENIVLLLWMFITSIYFSKRQINIMLLFSFSFTIMLFILIGVTTPVLGAIVRYKIPALPFFLFILFSFTNFEKLFNKIQYIWKKLF